MERKIIALFGGTFDPIHLGHTTVAQAAADHLAADRLVFIPVKQSPLKNVSPVASEMQRLEMIKLALGTHDRFDLSDFEVNGPVPSYTLHTVKHFRERFGAACSLHWLVGADAVQGLARWYGVSELLSLCSLSVMYRAGCETPDFSGFERIWGQVYTDKLKRQVIPTPLIPVSSTEVRNKIRRGDALGESLAPGVCAYIKEKELYR